MALKLLGLDPGRGADAFACVGVELEYERLTVRMARLWSRVPFAEVAADVAALAARHRPEYVVIERNGIGREAVEALRAAGVGRLYPVTTVAEVRPERRWDWQVMPKGEMVSWVRGLMAEGRLGIPRERSAPLQAFVDQFNAMSAIRQPAGGTKYEARRSGHDDAFMAFLLAAHMCRQVMGRRSLN